MMRGKQISKDSRGELNLLLIRQAYHNKKVKKGHAGHLLELNNVHALIQGWYQNQSEKVKVKSRAQEFQDSEKVTVYHHEIHKKLVKKSAILKLQTPSGIIEGHDACATFLENEVKNLLLTDAGLDQSAQNTLLEEISPCFTEADNIILRAPPTQ